MQSVAIPQLLEANTTVREAFVERYQRLLFPQYGPTLAQTPWRTHRGITRVTLWGRDHFRNNVRLAMVKEAMGLGPRLYRLYSVERSLILGFSERVFLLAQFLPHHKIYLSPRYGLPLRGPFSFLDHTREIGVAIANRFVSLEEGFPICLVCHSSLCDHVIDGLVDL